jgi:hypothetical protein
MNIIRALKKDILTRQIVLEQDRLFNDIDKVIQYLNELKNKYKGKNLSITDVWTGYEDVHYVAEYQEEETDDEYNERVEYNEMIQKEREAERKREASIKKKKAQIEKLQKEISKL